MLYSELRQKDVINVADGKYLGCVSDLEIDERTGNICNLIVPGPGKICGIFGRECNFVIEWKCIVRIGPDIILVNVCDNKCEKR